MAEDAPFYDESEEEEEEESEEEESGESGEEEEGKKKKKPKKKGYTMDPDHRLLLKNAKPLLQSRNAAVRFFNQIFITPPKKDSLLVVM